MTFNALELAQNIDTTTLVDMTETTTGGGARRELLPQGIAFLVFTTYIEYGKQPQEFDGKAKDPQLEFRLGFHIVGGVGTNKDGQLEDYVQNGFCPTVYAFDTAQSTNEKARAVKYFNAINTAPKKTHFLHKLGTLYTVEVTHAKSKAGKEYAKIDYANLQPAVDAATRKPYQHYTNAADEVVPMGIVKPEDYKVFLWSKPPTVTMEQYAAMWDSLAIEGDYETKDKDGNVTGRKSKNFLQEKCMLALDYAGSSLEQLQMGGVVAPPLSTEEEPTTAPTETKVVVEDDVGSDVEITVPKL